LQFILVQTEHSCFTYQYALNGSSIWREDGVAIPWHGILIMLIENKWRDWER